MIQGFVETVRSFQVRGWAWNSEVPDEVLSVELYLAGESIAKSIANIFREDLLAEKYGNGRHGFAINVDLNLFDVPISDISVYARAKSGETRELEKITAFSVLDKEHGSGLQPRQARSENIRIAAPALKSEVPFPYSSTEAAHHPVFILGAARSGTSAIAQALMAATRYRGHEEGHLLDMIGPLLRAIDRHYKEQSEEWTARSNTMIAALSKQFMEDGIKHIFVECGRRLFPDGWWIDKTPRSGMIAIIPLLRQIWPAARFVYMRRRAIENVASRMRKFPSVQFEDHCKDWAAVMNSWSAVRSTLGGAAIEIDQYYLAQSPNSVAEALAPLLILNADETANFSIALASDRPERTDEKFASKLSLADMIWPPEHLALFQEICGPVMGEVGYGLGEDYFFPGYEDQGLVIL